MIDECIRCERDDVEIRSRGLCGTCYQIARRAGTLDDYPLACDIVDHVQVDRATNWLTHAYTTTTPAQRHTGYTTGRPILSRAEKIAALDRVRDLVPPYVAAGLLGIGGVYSRRYLEAAGVVA